MSQQQESEFEIMDALDEQQIVDEIKGHVLEQFFYEFTQGNKQVVGISYAGIKSVCQKLSNDGHPISIEEMHVDVGPETISALACAVDLTTKEKRWGAAEASKTITFFDYRDKTEKTKPNPFTRAVAVSKAQRNAMRNFVPEVVIQEAYKEWKAKKGQQQTEKPVVMTAAELQAREAAKNFDKRVVCPDCQARFSTFEKMTSHRKESHSQ